MGQIILLLVLAVIPGYILFETSGYQLNSYDDSGGAGMFPAGIAWVMLLLIVVQIIRIAVKKGEEREESGKAVFISLFKGVPGVFLISVIVYAFLIPLLGFIISSSIFLICIGGYMSYKSRGEVVVKQITIQSLAFIGFAIALYLFFRLGINIYLPTGFLGI